MLLIFQTFSINENVNAASCAIVRLCTKFEYNGKLYCWMAHSNTTQMSHPQKYASQTESSIFGEVPHFAHFFKAASMKLQTRGRKWSELGSNEVTIFQNNAVGNFPLFAFIYFKESFRTWEMHIKNVKFCRKMASIFATTLLLLLQCLLHIKLYILAEQSCRVPPE